ncbi:MAG: 3-oxoadipate enol-lactonase [Actinomycetota bacterium]|nr:3-oxoadipate enol-lactonase [Actinomycetota bacterium]
MGAIALHHEITGSPGTPAVLLLNSLGSTLAMWERQVPELAERFLVVRCDTRGHGESPVPPGPYVIDDLVDDAVALLENLGIERAHVAGLSLGGMVALRLAARDPERVDRLAVLCASAQVGPPEIWAERAAMVRAKGTVAVADTVVGRWLTDARRAADPQTTDYLREMIAQTPADGYAACCDAIRDMDLSDDLAAITAPTLVVAAADDPSIPPVHQQTIAAGIPGSRLIELAECAHLATVDQPEAVTAALLEHFSKGSSANGAPSIADSAHSG